MQNQLQANQSSKKQPSTHHTTHPFLSHFFNMFDLPYSSELQNMEPKIEVYETKNNVMVTAELPGVNENDIDLEISTNGYLTISGEKRHENTEISKGGYFSEISYGHIRRTIPLPWELEYSKASAEYNNGILTVSIPKTGKEQNTKRKISVKKATKSSRGKKAKNKTNL